MNKITAADELVRLSVLFGSLTEVAEMLRNVGSLEQAAKEAKAAREAETAELEKTKAAVKRAKDDMKKQAELQDKQAGEWMALQQANEEAQVLQQNEHKRALAKIEAEAKERLDKLERTIAWKLEELKAPMSEELTKISFDIEAAKLEVEAKKAEAAELDAKLTQAKKSLAKLGMKFDD